jgi:hypothetical protein
MGVNAFTLNSTILDALEVSLSPNRIATYVTATKGDREKAIHPYTWNTAVSAAFYGPLQNLEVSVRNAMHRSLSSVYGPAWYDNPHCRLDKGALERIAKAKADLKKEGRAVIPPRLIAILTFGFWVSLLGRGGQTIGGTIRKANYDMTLWRPALYKAFPHVRRPRTEVHRPLDHLRVFRNRIAHHEPVFHRNLTEDYRSILEVAGWVCPSTRDWIAHHSRVLEALAQSREDTRLRF